MELNIMELRQRRWEDRMTFEETLRKHENVNNTEEKLSNAKKLKGMKTTDYGGSERISNGRKQLRKENWKTQSTHCESRKKRILMFADDTGRLICSKLHNMTDSDTTVSGNVFSGAGLDVILGAVRSNTEHRNFTKNDAIDLTGGSNDVMKYRNINRLLRRIDETIETLRHTNVIMCTLPYRYNQLPQSTCNRMITRFNEGVKNLTEYHGTSLIELNDLQTQDHTSLNQHLNGRGKVQFSKRIMQ
ncbi:uncharacterized protein LOC120353257 [Nilaparvata lugens]|uniref:uncharacterized protein LOC120353257 n=1 Tax=Nilaparvata lugens TaxID=108931 RepID=UPI00193E6829|nr:uncharacterized protein LOC120353257 [Nilaparvata lugens]